LKLQSSLLASERIFHLRPAQILFPKRHCSLLWSVNIGQKQFNAFHNFWKRKISWAKVEGWGYHGPDLKDFQPSLGIIDGNILD
jgi:hypothetical protein